MTMQTTTTCRPPAPRKVYGITNPGKRLVVHIAVCAAYRASGLRTSEIALRCGWKPNTVSIYLRAARERGLLS
jgi:(p)ppGpp synthase/HD superfamily hydrolase